MLANPDIEGGTYRHTSGMQARGACADWNAGAVLKCQFRKSRDLYDT